MKKKTVTVLAIEYSKRVCDPQPEFIDRMDVRVLVMSAYRSGYNKAHSEHDMSRLSDEWCCMNCVHQEECLSDDPNLNLLGYCIQYEDAETSN